MTLGRAGGYNVAFYSKKSEEGSRPLLVATPSLWIFKMSRLNQL